MSKQAYSHYLLEVKQEYTKQLSNLLVPVLYEGLASIYSEAKRTRTDTPMKMFQILLSKIPNWNQNIIQNEYNRIISKTQCDWLNDLITAVFISHAKILSSIKTKKKGKTLNLKVPNGDYFIHKAYIECARQFWKNPYLFLDNINTIEYQRNMRESELIIEQAINETIRKLLPVRNILQQYIAIDDESETSSSSSSEEESSSDEEKEKKKSSKKSKKDEDYITNTISEKDKKRLEKSVRREVSMIAREEDDHEDNFSTVSITNEAPTQIRKNRHEPLVANKNILRESEVENVVEPENREISNHNIESSPKKTISLSNDIEDVEHYPKPLSIDFPLTNINIGGADKSEVDSLGDQKMDVQKPIHKITSLLERNNYSIDHQNDRLDHGELPSHNEDLASLNQYDLSIDPEYSMNTRLDHNYVKAVKSVSKEKNSMKINIEDIPKIESSQRSEPPNEIKNIVIKPTGNTLESPERQTKPLGRRRDQKKNYSFFDAE